MIALCFEDGVEVDRRDAHGVEAGEVLVDPLERTAIEVPALDGFILVALVYRRLVPVHHQVLARALAGFVNNSLGTLEPVLVACVTIGEDLVYDAALVPSGTGFAVLVHGDLERGDVCTVGIGDRLSARGTITRADHEHRTIGACHAEAVPQDARFGAVDGRYQGVRFTEGHWDKLFAAVVDPCANLSFEESGIGVFDIQCEMNGGSGHNGAKRHAIFRPAGIMKKPHETAN